MQDGYGLSYRLKLLGLPEPWRSPINCLHDAAYENLKDINLRVVLLALRDMPFRPPSAGDTAFDCLNEWCGTSIGKHFAIFNLLRMIGLAPRIWMASYDMVPCLPLQNDALIRAARKYKVQDVHIYLTCDFGFGERIVDLTFPARLAEKGFIVTSDWKRTKDCALPCAPNERREMSADARGLCQMRMWVQALNPGIRMRYRQQIIDQIIARAATGDEDEDVRKRYIHRTYMQLN